MLNPYQTALNELAAVFEEIDDASVDAACRLVAGAARIAVYGCGREALQIKGFAMRLHHLGLDVSVVGDINMPPLGEGDLFLVTAGPGELATVLALMEVAKAAGAACLLFTAQPRSSAAKLADFSLLIPAQTMANDTGEERTSVLPMGSVYEGALFILFEVMVLKLKALRNVSADDMRARHTNLE